jgi:hypothetical protein
MRKKKNHEKKGAILVRVVDVDTYVQIDVCIKILTFT